MNRLLAGVLALLLSACATHSTAPIDQPEHMNPATRSAHDQVLEILKMRSDRTPASLRDTVGANLTDLNRIRPGRFEIYVFPKISNRNLKESRPVEEILGPPQVFDVSTIAEGPCQAFILKNQFAKLKPAEVFDPSLATDSKRRCGIVEVTSRKIAQMNRALVHRDDMLQVRLFLDDTYRVHGYDHAIYNDSRNVRMVRVKNTSNAPSFSGLTLFPIDMPGQGFKNSAADPGALVGRRLGTLPVEQIRNRYNRQFRIPSCQGVLSQGRDDYGQVLTVGWCRGMPWAHFIENSRFVAVTQPLSR